MRKRCSSSRHAAVLQDHGYVPWCGSKISAWSSICCDCRGQLGSGSPWGIWRCSLLLPVVNNICCRVQFQLPLLGAFKSRWHTSLKCRFSSFSAVAKLYFVYMYTTYSHYPSPWYNRHGWLGVKNRLSIQVFPACLISSRTARRQVNNHSPPEQDTVVWKHIWKGLAYLT